MIIFKIRVTPIAIRLLHTAAKQSGIPTSAWVRSVLYAVATREEISQWGLSVLELPTNSRRTATISIRVPPAELQLYRSAARQAQLTVSEWAATLIAVALGVSDLPDQLASITRGRDNQTASAPRESPDNSA